jgi:hypothetical protein
MDRMSATARAYAIDVASGTLASNIPNVGPLGAGALAETVVDALIAADAIEFGEDTYEEYGVRWTNPKTGQEMTSGAWTREVEADGWGRNNIARDLGVPYKVVPRTVGKWRDGE